MDEFGIGVALYFKSLKGIFVVILACAFVNLLAIQENKKFNPTQADIDADRANDPSLMEVPATSLQIQGSVYGAERNDLTFDKQVLSDILISIMIALFLIYAVWKEKKIVDRIDENQQTNQDYTIGMFYTLPHTSPFSSSILMSP